MRVTVLVRPKQGIRDPQGEAIGRSLNGLGYGVSAVHAGKIFDLDVDTDDAAEARRIGEEAAAKVLSNDLIEGFEVVVG
ncbi:MAG: phosphoribosylformylglycinamidine synthase subunit PurS [Gaiellales bacterium]